jgi:gamma-glutamylcyclotransferase (GGCT)/AIG2-like uncharacterized protein YtfP
MNAQRLFVYGTLRGDPSHEMFRILAENATFLGEGRVRGRLFSLGAYPGMVLSECEEDSVKGELYEVIPERWGKVIEELDSYEGCGPDDPEPHEYRRSLVDVMTDSGQDVHAWAYLLERPTTHLEKIPFGDFLAWRVAAGGSRR